MSDDTARTLCLTHKTALLYWRAVHEGRLPPPAATTMCALPACCATGFNQLASFDLEQLGITLTTQGALSTYECKTVNWGSSSRRGQLHMVPQGLAAPPGMPFQLDVATSVDSHRHMNRAIKPHLMLGALPVGSFCRVSDSILVASPELTYAQACLRNRNLPNIELALELCGTYALFPDPLPCGYDRYPVMSAEGLRSFVAGLGRRAGALAARRAAEWVVDGLASPREADLYLLLTLPLSAGGYGLDRPSVNYKIPVKGTMAEMLSSSSFYVVDLVWVKQHVVVEYDGLDDHEESSEQVAADKERRSVLAAMKYTVIVVTGRDFASEAALQTKVSQIALSLGVDLIEPTGDERERRSSLVKWLCNTHRDHLPFGFGYR